MQVIEHSHFDQFVEEVKKIVRDFKTEYLMESILVPILLNLD